MEAYNGTGDSSGDVEICECCECWVFVLWIALGIYSVVYIPFQIIYNIL